MPVVSEVLAGNVDALVVTVLASGGSNASDAEGWDATALAALDVPVLQALCVTSSRADWEASDAGTGPDRRGDAGGDPEFDGRW
jgi:cobaltochelatase CobN